MGARRDPSRRRCSPGAAYRVVTTTAKPTMRGNVVEVAAPLGHQATHIPREEGVYARPDDFVRPDERLDMANADQDNADSASETTADAKAAHVADRPPTEEEAAA